MCFVLLLCNSYIKTKHSKFVFASSWRDSVKGKENQIEWKKLNRETEQKTGDDVNKNKLVTETEEPEAETEENKDKKHKGDPRKRRKDTNSHMMLTAS